MSRKADRNKASSIAPGIEWHDDEESSPRKKEKHISIANQRLTTMSELVERMSRFPAAPNTADIETLQILARGEDINIESLEI